MQIDPKATALLVIDMQNGFLHPEGTLSRDGVDVAPLREIIPAVKGLVGLCRSKGIPVIWSMQEHYPQDKAREAHRITPHTMKRINIPCLKGSWDAEIIEELKPLIEEESHIIRKQKFSCFYNTNLEVLLRILGVNTLIMAGVMTFVCVETTARDAYMRDYDIIVVEDCVAGHDRDLHGASLKFINLYLGMVIKSGELENMLA